MKLRASTSSAVSRLFSAGVFHELAKHGKSPLFLRLLREGELSIVETDNQTVADVFDNAFEILRKSGARNEYVYRSALVRNVLMGKHSLNTASMLTEFRVGQSKADLVILNGTASVYEIKSERDTLARLEKQIADYRKVFAKVSVIAGVDHVEDVTRLVPETVGVLCLRRWNRISTLRDAVDCSHEIDTLEVLASVRKGEAASILTMLEVAVPDVPNTKLHQAMVEVFEKLDPEQVHKAMVAVLKTSRKLSTLSEFVDQLPFSLQAAALTYKVRKSDQAKLVAALNTPLRRAQSWA